MSDKKLTEAEIITKSDYYENHHYMSYSEFVGFKHCEARQLAIIKGEFVPETSKAYLAGGYIDAYFSGESKEFADKHPEIYGRNGLKADFVQCDEVIRVIEADEYFHSFYKGEPQVIETGVINGVPYKTKMDFLFDDKIVDMKLMKDTKDIWVDGVGKIPFWKAYGYDVQAAIYQYIHSQNSGKILPYYLAVATKEDTCGKYLFEFSAETLKSALEEVIALSPRYQSIKEGKIDPNECGMCDYYKKTHVMSGKDIVII